MGTPRHLKKNKKCTCRICGKEFLASRDNARLCQDYRCQYIYHKKIKIEEKAS